MTTTSNTPSSDETKRYQTSQNGSPGHEEPHIVDAKPQTIVNLQSSASPGRETPCQYRDLDGFSADRPWIGSHQTSITAKRYGLSKQ